MKDILRSDIIRVLYNKPRTLGELHRDIIMLRLSEKRTGRLRMRCMTFWPRKTHIRWRLRKLRQMEEPRVRKVGNKYQLTDRGVDTFIWYLKGLNPIPDRQQR